MRFVLGCSVEWGKLSLLILSDSETTKRQFRFLPAQKRELNIGNIVSQISLGRFA